MKRDKDAAELAWKMFEKTGNVSYYMLIAADARNVVLPNFICGGV